jgi:hypothetical protein
MRLMECLKSTNEKMKSLKFAFLLCTVASCSMDEKDIGLQLVTRVYDFNESSHEWQAGFCDLPATSYDSAFYELQSGYVSAVIDGEERKALMLSGNNHSDDLFMYSKKKITGLDPDSQYTLTFEVQLASNALESGVGVGGAPGESVFLKVGASSNEPRRVIDDDGNYILNIDKGNQSLDGEDMIVIGDISVPAETEGYATISRSNSPSAGTQAYDKPLIVKTNSKGELWLIVGTDSGYEGITTLYYTSISVVLSRSN